MLGGSAKEKEPILKDEKEGFAAGKNEKGINSMFINSVVFAVIYVFIGVIAYSYIFEKWTIIDSLFFTVVTFSTIGYGDLNPTTDTSRAFTVVFGLTGIAALGFTLGILGERLSESRRNSFQEERNKRIASLFKEDRNDKEGQNITGDINVPQDSVFSIVRIEIATHAYNILFLLIMAIGIGFYEGWTIITSIYYTTITATTVGYGDIEPKTQLMRLLCTFIFIPISVCVMGSILGGISSGIIEMENSKANREFFQRKLTVEDIIAMDTNEDGEVDKVEFLKFMLIALDKVDEPTVDAILKLFDTLDHNKSGTLQKNGNKNQTSKNPHVATYHSNGGFLDNFLNFV